MKKDIMDIICCPTCKGDLTLSIEKEEKNDVISGSLTCKLCKNVYFIEEGIPNLLPKQ